MTAQGARVKTWFCLAWIVQHNIMVFTEVPWAQIMGRITTQAKTAPDLDTFKDTCEVWGKNSRNLQPLAVLACYSANKSNNLIIFSKPNKKPFCLMLNRSKKAEVKLQSWRPVIFHVFNFSSATRGLFWNVTIKSVVTFQKWPLVAELKLKDVKNDKPSDLQFHLRQQMIL